MELTQLQYFKTVARTQNISQAAKALHMTQPALSRAISRLEEELGVKLFDRSGNRIILSHTGMTFLDRVDNALREIERGVEEVRAAEDEDYEEVAFSSFMVGGVTPPLLELLLQHKNVRLRHFSLPLELLKSSMEDGETDIAITLSPIESDRINWTPVAHDELIALVNSANPLFRKEYVAPEELMYQRICLMASENGVKEIFDGGCAMAGVAPNVIYTGSDSELGMSLLRRNACILVSPASAHVWKREEDMRQNPQTKGDRPFPFRAMRFKGSYFAFNYGLCMVKDKPHSRAVFALLDMLRKYLSAWNERCESEGLDRMLNV